MSLSIQGKTAIAGARVAYAAWLAQLPLPGGAQPQRLLWASTSTKNPAYRDVRYVEELIGQGTVNTVPDPTLVAFRDHGEAASTLDRDLADAQAALVPVHGASPFTRPSCACLQPRLRAQYRPYGPTPNTSDPCHRSDRTRRRSGGRHRPCPDG